MTTLLEAKAVTKIYNKSQHPSLNKVSFNISKGEFIGLKQGKSKIIRESKYNTALQQLQKEELLKTEFANFLHEDVLQDLLSVKNMMTKSHRPEIQKIIIETLDNLNIHIVNKCKTITLLF